MRKPGSKATPLWTCPVCGRSFAKTHQWHSCRTQSVADHFRGKPPRLRAIFETLVGALKASGPLRVDAVPSSINLISRYHFGGIAIRRDYVRVGFIADHEIEDRRIRRRQRVGDRRVSHSVVVRTRADIDAKLLGWLAEAQALQARVASKGRGARRRSLLGRSGNTARK